MRGAAMLLVLAACNGDPGEPDQGVTYRDGSDGGPNSGERGNLNISEILWSGSVSNDGSWDPLDQFVEIRNEGNRPINLSGWILQIDGSASATWRVPKMDEALRPGDHLFIATKDTGCFREPDLLLPQLHIPYGDPFRLMLRDADERLIEPAGSLEHPPYAGGYDLVESRSMEKIQLMFGGRGSEPHSWHFYTPIPVDVPNNDQVAADCRRYTLASPGRPNSPDYSGAFASGSLE
ncbi:MAG: hypothetical protein ACI8PZ_002490 [Myxococcota bacterium]|jgi:hypothetical protein